MATNPSPSSNVFLFYGEDDFSLRRKIEHWKSEFAKKYSGSSISILDAESAGDIDLIKKLKDELAPSLFSSKKLIVVRNALPRKADSPAAGFLLEFVPQVPKDIFLVFWEANKPDGRLLFTKKFISLVTATEFNLPHGGMLNQWIMAMAKNLNVSVSAAAADKLAEFVGRDLYEEKKPVPYNLWQVYSELQKLASKTDKVEVKDVQELVRAKVPDSVFALTDEIVARNKKGAFQALENFLASQTADEKSAFIKIIALLSEQIRSLLVVSLLSKQGLTNDQVAEKLGWSSGRVFVTSKNARNASVEKLAGLLKELLLIDAKIKSTDANLKLPVDLFILQAVS